MTTWNFGGFQQDMESSLDSLGIFNTLPLKRKGNCSVDLKLGRIDEPIDGLLDTWSVPQGLKRASDSRLNKRARKIGGANSSVYCLVEGCQSDFSNSREYHKRHKVCEIHAKTPIVMVAGQQQRFCQQCSRFHLLKEFDEIKRSCRKRLDGHNRRRRKVQPDPFSVTSTQLFHTPYQGCRIPSYPQILTRPEVSCSEHSLSPSLHDNQQFFPLNYCNQRTINGWQPLPSMFTSSQTNRALSLLSLTNSSLDTTKMDDIMQAADTLSMLRPSNSGTKHFNCNKLYSDSSNYNEFFCSDNLWRTPSNNPFVLEKTHLVSGLEVTSCITGEQTESDSSPTLHSLPAFWSA